MIQCKFNTAGKDMLQNIRHFHNDAEEILFVERGGGVMTVGDHIYPLAANCIYFIERNLLHYSAPDDAQTYTRSVISVPSDFFAQLCALSGYDEVTERLRKKKCVMLEPQDARRIRAAMERIQNCSRRESVTALFEILDLADRQGSSVPLPDNKVSGILAYINAHIGEPLTLDEISAHLFIGKYYMCHLFRETTGMSISQYVLLRRLSLCKNLLITTERSISDIAMTCGFSTFSYFCRAFAKSEGMSAREYRKKFTPIQKND